MSILNIYSPNELQSEDIYSTEEMRIGTWIDGKPLYRKVLSGLTSPASNSSTIVESGVKNPSIFVLCRGFIGPNTNGFVYQSNYLSSGGYIIINPYTDGRIEVRTTVTGSYSLPMTIILEYTKTTD